MQRVFRDYSLNFSIIRKIRLRQYLRVILYLTIQYHDLTVQLDSTFHIVFSINIRPNAIPLCDIRVWNISDLKLDHSRLLKVKPNDISHIQFSISV